MSIVYELRQWEGGVYYFSSTAGKTPISRVSPVEGGGWDVLFYRGPANLGPYRYVDFARAKDHLFRYLVPRENELMGEPHGYGMPGHYADRPSGEPPATRPATNHPHRRRYRNWVTRPA